MRLDMPVTSATSVLKEDLDTKTTLGVVPKGIFEQYALSLANRDPEVFKDPTVFDPKRKDGHFSLTFNGRAFTKFEKNYPRICPGRKLALSVLRTIIDSALDDPDPTVEPEP